MIDKDVDKFKAKPGLHKMKPKKRKNNSVLSNHTNEITNVNHTLDAYITEPDNQRFLINAS